MKQVLAFEQAVLGTIQARAAIGDGQRLLVAVSGGADSTALLAVLEALLRRGALRATLAVAHLNHGLRGAESARDAAAVAALAGRFGLPCFVEECTALGPGSANLEARARALRSAFLQRVGGRWAADRIALAHTRDDQAETVLMRLARGGGPASLASMQPARPDGVIRPLLEQSRAACIAYLGARGLDWVEDSSNEDERFFRNRVRRRLLPALEAELGVDVRQRLARLARQLREESALAEQRVAQLLAGTEPGGCLDLEPCRAAGEGAPRLVHAWLDRAGVRASERQIAGIVRIAAGACPSAAVDLGAGIRVVRRYQRLEIEHRSQQQGAPSAARVSLPLPGSACIPGWRVRSEADLVPASQPLERGTDEGAVVLDADRLTSPLSLRSPAAGDRVRLAYGRRKLADILIDAKVPRQERRRLAVVSCGDDILWVPGVVRSVVAGTSPATRRFAVLHAQRQVDGG
jgi:tRNA(Ile)-lysidine synthase